MSILAILKGIGVTALLTPILNYMQPSKPLVSLDVAPPTRTCVGVFAEVIIAGTPTQPFRPTIAVRMYNSSLDTPLGMPFDAVSASTLTHASKDHHIMPKSTYNASPHAMAPVARTLFTVILFWFFVMSYCVSRLLKRVAAVFIKTKAKDQGLIDMSGTIRELQGEADQFSGIIATLCKYFGGVLQDVKNQIGTFEGRLAHFRARLTTNERGFFSLLQRVRDLEMAARTTSQERHTDVQERQQTRHEIKQLRRELQQVRQGGLQVRQEVQRLRQGGQQLQDQTVQLEMYLRRYIPSNVQVGKAYCKMISKVPAGDLAFLIQCWMKATDIQSDLHNMNINHNADDVEMLASLYNDEI